MTDEIEYGSGSESEPTKSNVDEGAAKRNTKAGFKVGRLVQKEVEEEHNGQKHRYARQFIVRQRMYQEERDRWLYKLNTVKIDGTAGPPYNENQWYRERDLSHVLSN